MSQRSLPKSQLDVWGEPLLISANQKLACPNPSGINYMFWLRRYSLTRPVRGLQCLWRKHPRLRQRKVFEKLENGNCVVFYRLSSQASLIFQLASWSKHGFQIHCYCNFSSYFTNVRASKIPQHQLKLLLSLLVAKRGGRWGRLRANAAEDFVDYSLVEFKLTLII